MGDGTVSPMYEPYGTMCTKIMYKSYFSTSFTNSDARIRFHAKFYIGNMLVLDMLPQFFTQAAAMKE